MTLLQFVTRQRIARAQQLIREISRSQIEIALEVGYTSRAGLPAGLTPSDYRRQRGKKGM